MDLADAISRASDPGAVLRTGTLTGISGTAVTVDIGGGQLVDMPRVEQYTPILGDPVQILQQGPVNLVLGAPAGMPDTNAVVNASFENDPSGTSPPTGWTVFFDPGGITDVSATAETATIIGAKDGAQWLRVLHGPTVGYAGCYLCSTSIAVNPGERWSAAAYAFTAADAGDDQPQLHLTLAFFASLAGVYSEDLLSETELQTIFGPTGPTWIPLRAIGGTGTVVPDGAGAMRVILWTEISGGSVYWDKIVARRIGTV